MPNQNKAEGDASVFLGAATCLINAASVAIGASLCGHSVHDEAIAYLAGGSITGTIAGAVGAYAIRRVERSNLLALKLCSKILKSVLYLAATVAAPFVAELLVDNSSSEVEMLEDVLIGSAIIAAGVLGLGMLSAVVSRLNRCCRHSNSSSSSPAFFRESREGLIEEDRLGLNYNSARFVSSGVV